MAITEETNHKYLLGKINIVKTSTPVFIVNIDHRTDETKNLFIVDNAVYKNYISK